MSEKFDDLEKEELVVEIKEDDLDRSHRLGKPKRKDNKLRTIIVNFTR